MNQILTMREKRASLWDAAKKYRDSHIGNDGTMSAEDAAVYDRMVDDVDRMKKEIDRLERQEAIENEMNRPTASPILGRPENPITGEDKKGRASDSYKKAFWQNMRSKSVSHEVFNALQIGTDSEGGFLVPDEYERTLVDTLQEENIFRRLAHVISTESGDRKIPVVASKGTASWIDEEAAYPESDDSFGQVSIGAHKLATMIKISEELLNDSVFDMPSYIAREFARRIGAAEEEAFELRPLCLNDCLEDSLVQFFVAFAERGIEPKIDICAERVERKSNRDALARIFGNIVGNAVRYSGGDFAVTLTPDGKIVFENAAPQLDEVSTMKLFDRFFTIENARGSTGLGLSIAKVLTERLGGSICASWREGRLYIELRL